MSLAARCPWCETVFRLTEGQVSAKGGMARCGVCSHTFNALDALLSDSAVAALERGAQARKDSEESSFRKTDPLGSQRITPRDDAPSVPSKTVSPSPSAPSPPPLTPAPTTPLREAVTPAAASAIVEPPANPGAPPLNSPLSTFRLPAFLMGNRQAAPTDKPAPAIAAPLATPAPVSPAPVSIAPVPAPAVSGPVVIAPVVADNAIPAFLIPPTSAPTPPVSAPSITPPAQPSPVPALASQTLQSPANKTAPPTTTGADEAVANYDVALPNYDAASAEVETNDDAVSDARKAELSQQIDQLQAALAVADERVPVQPEPALRDMRLPDAALSSRSELAREQERLGPSTFQPSFLKADEGSPGWQRVRTFFTFCLCLIAALGLVLQAAYWWRVEIAVKVPVLKPYLDLGCAQLHCEITPPAQIEQLSIESSELIAVPGSPNTLAFTALLRNHSSAATAYPAIEVTLTDARDRAVLRRDFLPSNYLNDTNRQRQLAGIAPSSEYAIKLTFDTSGIPTTGYRAGIFYP